MISNSNRSGNVATSVPPEGGQQASEIRSGEVQGTREGKTTSDSGIIRIPVTTRIKVRDGRLEVVNR